MYLILYYKKTYDCRTCQEVLENYFCYVISLLCNVLVLKILLHAMQFSEFHVTKE